MADFRNAAACRDSVCISCNRILDSCRDKDCFENVRVYLDDCGQEMIEKSGAVRVKCANVIWTQLTVDPVQFNRGFYSVQVRYYVRVVCECCICPGHAQETEGIAVCEKRVILYGGEGCVSVFRSRPDQGFCSVPDAVRPEGDTCCESKNSLPTAICEVAEPVVLDARILEKAEIGTCCCCCCNGSEMPAGIWTGSAPRFGQTEERILAVSLGFFSVIRLERPAQFVINAAEYTVPEKECCEPPENDPCAMFRRMQFPVGTFETSCAKNTNCGCGA